MNRFRLFLVTVPLLLTLAVCAQGQGGSKRFEKDGLAFSYPFNWTIKEASTSSAIVVNLVPAASDLQVQVSMRREIFDSPDKVTQGRETAVENTVKSYEAQMKGMGMTTTRTNGATTFGSSAGEVVRVRGKLDGVEGETGIYWAAINSRLVMVVTFGPDQDLKKQSSALEALRASITPAAPAAAEMPAAPAPSPAPSPSPKP